MVRVASRIAFSMMAILVLSGFALGISTQVEGAENYRTHFAGEEIELILTPGTAAKPELDPSDEETDFVFALQLINRTDRAIRLPANYDGARVRLCGKSTGMRWALSLVSLERQDSDEITIEPGESHVCFELTSRAVIWDIANNFGKSGRQPYGWTWSAHPSPPTTPIHWSRPRDKLADFAVFWGEVEIEGQTFRSEPIIIPVKD